MTPRRLTAALAALLLFCIPVPVLPQDPPASVFVTVGQTASVNTTFNGTWTAYNEGPVTVAQSSDSAFVEVVATPVPTVGWWSKIALVLLLMLFSGMYFHGRRLRARR